MITVTFGNDKMGSLLIVKKDAVTGAPISDVEFLGRKCNRYGEWPLRDRQRRYYPY